MRLFTSRPALRWLTPLAFVLAISGTALVATTATAERKLPTRTAEQLLVDVQQAQVDGLSGTVIQRANLGIPEIPGAGGPELELTSLISGTHTLRVRFSEPDKFRLAVLGTLGETDVITNGKDLWIWSSEDQAATPPHGQSRQPAGEPDQRRRADLPRTPQEAAEQVLAAIEPTTTVTTDSDVNVADRAAYELVLDPERRRHPDQPGPAGRRRRDQDAAAGADLRQGQELVFEVGYDSVTSPGRTTASSSSTRRRGPR